MGNQHEMSESQMAYIKAASTGEIVGVTAAGPIPKKTRVALGGELTGAILMKGMIMDRPAGQIAKVRNVWTKPHQGAREIARRKARMDQNNKVK